MPSWIRVWLLLLTVVQIPAPNQSLAQLAHSEGKRKMVTEIRPVYPILARNANISGKVRLRITVSSAGYPIEMQQLGGSPILMKAAIEAASKAKWESAPVETKELIVITFDTNQK